MACILGFLLLPGGASQVAYAQARAYVANSGSNSVSLIDTSSNTVTGTIAVGSQPLAIAITPDGTRAYLAHCGGDVWVIDTSSNKVVTKIVVGGCRCASRLQSPA
jgi:YVTN family beta-propeller protein